jgi:hypothetical protein
MDKQKRKVEVPDTVEREELSRLIALMTQRRRDEILSRISYRTKLA